MIKIGTSQALRKRLASLSRSTGKPQLLVVEPGGYQRERSRHSQFASLRTAGTELFRPATVLLEHIDNLCQKIPHWRGMANVGHEWD
ncbi:GIY-YIG nuclease family protein [Sphaerisporangium melleum]|nr:GIY-YIG nuclease family protein [Sphaerisporangium melleum]